MTYELAKELKKAGFPLQEHYEPSTRDSNLIDGVMYEFPTLSELIEACGDRFLELHRMSTGQFFASDGVNEGVTGDTPEITMARLYLAIHTPKPEQP